MARAKRDILEYLSTYAVICAVPRISAAYRPKRRVTMRVEMPGRLVDPDNFLKGTLDGLKNARLIVDDSVEWLDMQMPTVEHARELQTILTFQDVI